MVEDKEQTKQSTYVALKAADERDIILVDTTDSVIKLQLGLADTLKNLCGIDYNFLLPQSMQRTGKRGIKNAVYDLNYNREILKFENVKHSNQIEFDRTISHKRLEGVLKNSLYQMRDLYIEFNQSSVELENASDDELKSSIRSKCGMDLDQIQVLAQDVSAITNAISLLDDFLELTTNHDLRKINGEYIPYNQDKVFSKLMSDIETKVSIPNVVSLPQTVANGMDLNLAENEQLFTVDNIEAVLDNIFDMKQSEVNLYLQRVIDLSGASAKEFPAPDIKKPPTAFELKKTSESNVFVTATDIEKINSLHHAVVKLIEGFKFDDSVHAHDLFSTSHNKVYLKSDFNNVEQNIAEFICQSEDLEIFKTDKNFVYLMDKYVELAKIAGYETELSKRVIEINTSSINELIVEFVSAYHTSPEYQEHIPDNKVMIADNEGENKPSFTEEEYESILESESEINLSARGGWGLFGLDKQTKQLNSDEAEQIERDD